MVDTSRSGAKAIISGEVWHCKNSRDVKGERARADRRLSKDQSLIGGSCRIATLKEHEDGGRYRIGSPAATIQAED